MQDKKLWFFTLLTMLFSLGILISNFSTQPINFSVNDGDYNINQFLFFTIQSNFIVLFWLLGVVVSNLFGWTRIYNCLNLPNIRGIVTCWITVTGIIFTFILYPVALMNAEKNNDPLSFVSQFYQISLHMIIPLAIIINTFIFRFKKRTDYKKFFAICYTYPLGYAIIAIIIGDVVGGKYPYFFMDPNNNIIGFGFVGVFIWVILLIIFFGIVMILFRLKMNNSYQKFLNTQNKK